MKTKYFAAENVLKILSLTNVIKLKTYMILKDFHY